MITLLKVLYVTQESSNNAATATSTANTALTNSNTAISTANSAVSTANTASSNASAAVSTANTASSNASAAVSTANTASSNATTAVNTANAATATANSAASDAATAISTANSAVSTANTASTAATNAVNTANSASSAASSAVSTANTASSNASAAVSTANTASSSATSAVNTANSALSTANAAASAVANAILYDIVANVAAIPASPANNDAVEVTDSTGIESFTPLTGIPGGFAGNSGLSVRIVYTTTGNTWTWIQYFPNDPETRYLKEAGDTMTGALGVTTGTAAAPSVFISGDPNTGIYSPGADQVAVATNGTGRLFVDASGNVGVGAAPTQLLQLGSFGGNDSNLQFAANTAGASNILFGDGSSGADFYRGLIKYNHATDALELLASSYSTITTNGSERLRITSAGLVGIGTSSPSSTAGGLDISSGGIGLVVGADGSTVTRTNSTDKIFRIGSYHYTNAEEPVCIAFGQNLSSGNELNFGGGSVALNAATYIKFFTAANNTTTSGTERMRITSAGNVGIGTTSPTYLCNVIAAAGSQNIFQAGQTGISNGYTITSNGTNLTHAWFNGGSEAARIDSSGRLGIGTSAPGKILNAKSASQYDGFLLSNASNSVVEVVGFSATNDNGAVLLRNAGTANVQLLASGASYFNGGNVGIGTTSPQSRFVVSNNGAEGIEIRPEFSDIISYNRSGATWGDLKLNAANNIFQIQGAEKARIDNSGRLLVGTSTTSKDFSAVFQGNSADATGGANLLLARGTSSPADGSAIGYLSFTDSNHNTTAQIQAQRDGGTWTSGTSQPGRLVFSTTADGASSPTERMRIGSGGHLYATCSDTSLASLTLRKGAAGADGIDYLQCRDSGNTAKLVIASTGNVQNTNGSYTSFSDAKLKENIIDANSQWSDIKAVKIRNWNFKTETGYQTHRQIGPIAQELETICPNLVFDVPDRNESGEDIGTVTKGVNQSVLYMKAVKALQEAMERIETLEGMVAVNNITIDEQQHQLSTLAARLTALESA
jgi:hypothetical protein